MMHLISETGAVPVVDAPAMDPSLPYGGDIQAAMRAQDRVALRVLFEARERRENPQAAEQLARGHSSSADASLGGLPGALNSSTAEISPMLPRRQGSAALNNSSQVAQSPPTMLNRSAMLLDDPLDGGGGLGSGSGLMNRSSMLDHTASTEPDVSFGSAYQSKMPSVHSRNYSMAPGRQHALGLRYIRGRRERPPP